MSKTKKKANGIIRMTCQALYQYPIQAVHVWQKPVKMEPLAETWIQHMNVCVLKVRIILFKLI